MAFSNRVSVFVSRRDNLSGVDDSDLVTAPMADDVCPWEVADGGDKKRSLPTSIAEERERRLSTSSSRKNSGGNATYDSASADEMSQSDPVPIRVRGGCSLSSGGGRYGDRRHGSSATCTPQQTVDRPSVSSAEDFDLGPSPESRSPEKQQQLPTSPHDQPVTVAVSLDSESNGKKLLKTLSLARKQSVTPVINVSSVDRDSGGGGGRATVNAAEKETLTPIPTVAAECSNTSSDAAAAGAESNNGSCPQESSSTGTVAEGATMVAAAVPSTSSNNDGNDVCPWEDE